MLGLSKSEEKILRALQSGVKTPLALFRETKVSRPAIYAILKKFKDRGLAVSRIKDGKRFWRLVDERTLDEALYSAKRMLLNIPEGREEVHGRVDSAIVVHRGAEAVKKLFKDLFAKHPNQRFYGFQGHESAGNWNRLFSTAETNKINRDIKRNSIITEGVFPEHWFEEQTHLLGVEWAKDFEGRTARISVIEPKYFEHEAQLWIFKDTLYLLAINEEMVIEVRNSEIQKMIQSIFGFIQDNARTIDGNALLRKLIAEVGDSKTTSSKK